MTNIELAEKCKKIATQYKTTYVSGCFGAPLTPSNKARWAKEYPKNANRPGFQAADSKTFGFDCVNLIKAIIWGWNGDYNAPYGGAKYQSNGLKDINESMLLAECTEVTTNFNHIEVGEYLWMSGHCGVYIGDGFAVECTPAWSGDVQITTVGVDKPGYHRRSWIKHGKLPGIEYAAEKHTQTMSVDLPIIRKGDKGEAVKALQALLLLRDYGMGVYGADGDFGGMTDKAVRKYQEDHKLAVDGEVGRDTWTSLLTKE